MLPITLKSVYSLGYNSFSLFVRDQKLAKSAKSSGTVIREKIYVRQLVETALSLHCPMDSRKIIGFVPKGMQ